MKQASMWRWLLGLCICMMAPALVMHAQAQPKRVTLGADLNPDQRAALLTRFGATEGVDDIRTITTPDMIAAMQGIIPIAEGVQSLSSSALTCGAPGSGLHIVTENITLVTAAQYAGALLTAGIGDAELIVAAPTDAPADGLAALTGIFRGFEGGACGRGELDPLRRELAYRWLQTTVNLGGALNDQAAAARLVLLAHWQLIDGGKSDPAAVEPALNNASAEIGVTPPPEQRPAVLDLLRRIAEAKLDWGTYATGWEVQAISPNEVRLAARGAPTTDGAASGGSTLTGKVRGRENGQLQIEVPGQTTSFTLNANTLVVTRNGQSARLDDLQPGDSVTIQVDANNVATAIDARSDDFTGDPAGAAPSRFVIGTVEENNEGQLAVNSAAGRQQYVVPTTAYVAREGQKATISDIQPQDSAVLVVDSNGAVQSVFARPTANAYVLDGTVEQVSVSDGMMRVNVGEPAAPVTVPLKEGAITRDGQPANIDAIQPGDQVAVRFTPAGQVEAVDAQGGGGNWWSRWRMPRSLSLPLILLLLLAVLAAIFLLARPRRPGQSILVLPGRRTRNIDPDDIDEINRR